MLTRPVLLLLRINGVLVILFKRTELPLLDDQGLMLLVVGECRLLLLLVLREVLRGPGRRHTGAQGISAFEAKHTKHLLFILFF